MVVCEIVQSYRGSIVFIMKEIYTTKFKNVQLSEY